MRLTESRERFETAKRERGLQLRDVDPYGRDSEHSWVRDSAAVLEVGGDPLASERLARFRSAYETRAVSTATLSFISGVVLPPWIEQAVSSGIRSVAPLASALLRLDLPPSGDSASWAVVSTPADMAAGSQSAENATIDESTDPVVDSEEDDLKTLAGNILVSAQSIEWSGGWSDRVLGEELGRAFGARLESELWIGPGTGGRITGLTVMTGSSSSTVAAQTLAAQTAEIWQQFDSIAANLGELPDLIAMAPRRAGGLGSLTSAIGLPFEEHLPSSVRERIVVSPAAPTNLGAGTNEDWIVEMNRAAVPLVAAPEPIVQMNREQAGNALAYRIILYAYVALGVSRRPSGVGLIKGLTAPAY